MNNMQNPNTQSTAHKDHIMNHVCSMRCVSWTAIIMGAIAAISFSFLFNLLGLAIGVTAFPAATTAAGQTTYAAGGFAGLVIFAIVAMFSAGWIAGILGRSHCLRRNMGELYGLGTWGLALIVTILLASSMGQFISESSYLVNRTSGVNIRVTDAVNTAAFAPAHHNTNETTLAVNPQTAQESAGVATFATFFIFFIGLLSACFGGRCGMIYNRRAAMNDPHCQQCCKK